MEFSSKICYRLHSKAYNLRLHNIPWLALHSSQNEFSELCIAKPHPYFTGGAKTLGVPAICSHWFLGTPTHSHGSQSDGMLWNFYREYAECGKSYGRGDHEFWRGHLTVLLCHATKMTEKSTKMREKGLLIGTQSWYNNFAIIKKDKSGIQWVVCLRRCGRSFIWILQFI